MREKEGERNTGGERQRIIGKECVCVTGRERERERERDSKQASN